MENKKTFKERLESFSNKLSGRQIVTLALVIGSVAVMISGKDGWDGFYL